MLQKNIDLVDALKRECVVSSPLVTSEAIFADAPIVLKLLNSVPNIYTILNSKQEIIFANQALYDWLDSESFETALGLRAGEVFGCVNARQSLNECMMNEHCRTCGVLRALTASSFGEDIMQECRIVQEAGEALDLRVRATPFSLHGHGFTLLAINDISHEKRRYALERVFFHDILNTASSVQGFAKLLLDVSTGDYEDMVTIINDMANQLVDEIRAQQVLSSAESGELNFNMATVDSLYILTEIVTLYRNHDAGLDRKIHIDSRSEVVDFDSDPALVRRVLGNMVLNALEASSPGQAVTVGCHAVGDQEVEFVVHNPQYMTNDVQLQVFQRSYSTKGGGRGLGTYSMKLLTERYLQGRISFTTSERSGTVFTARYPRRMLPSWMVA